MRRSSGAGQSDAARRRPGRPRRGSAPTFESQSNLRDTSHTEHFVCHSPVKPLALERSEANPHEVQIGIVIAWLTPAVAGRL